MTGSSGFLLAVAIVTAAPIRAQTAPIALDPRAVIGCLDCDGPELFTSLTHIWVTERGGVGVVDGTSPFVRIFDPAGAVRHAFGRRGGGPGEYRSVVGAESFQDGRLAVVDLSLQRVSLYDSAAQFQRSLPTDGIPLGTGMSAADGSLWVIVANPRIPSSFHRSSLTGEGWVRIEPDVGDLFGEQASAGFVFLPFAAGSDGRFAVGDGKHAYLIRVYDRRGRAMYDVTHAADRVRKTDDQLESERGRRSRLAGAVAERARSGRRPARIHGGAPDPYQPHFSATDLRFDHSGHLWVKTPRARERGTLFDVFDPSGAYLGEVLIPTRVSRFDVRNGTLAAIVLDDLDVESVRTWTVTYAAR